MLYTPTHAVTITGGTGTDDYGDPVDGTTTIAADVPMSILEQARRVFRPADGRWDTVATVTGRAPAVSVLGTTITRGMVITDPASGNRWAVDSARTPANPAGAQDQLLQLTALT